MTTFITTGNLTKDAEVKTSEDGRSYVLLSLAENIFKRDEKGKVLKNAEGHYETQQTMFYSIFVSEKGGALSASSLTKGQAIKVFATPKIKIEKDARGYDRYVIDSLRAFKIDTNPYQNAPEEELAGDDIPLE